MGLLVSSLAAVIPFENWHNQNVGKKQKQRNTKNHEGNLKLSNAQSTL